MVGWADTSGVGSNSEKSGVLCQSRCWNCGRQSLEGTHTVPDFSSQSKVTRKRLITKLGTKADNQAYRESRQMNFPKVSVCLSVRPSVRPSVYLSVCLYVCMSVCELVIYLQIFLSAVCPLFIPFFIEVKKEAKIPGITETETEINKSKITALYCSPAGKYSLSFVRIPV